MSSIQAQIEQATAEYCELCARYDDSTRYLVPDTPRRMAELQRLLNGPGGLWEQRRRELAAEAAARMHAQWEPAEEIAVVRSEAAFYAETSL